MKYIDLKKNLKNGLENAYLIYGEDRYLCYDALKKIQDKAELNLSDMNVITLDAESSKITAKDIVDSANVYPFCDNYRVVVVKGFAPSKNKEEFNILQNYLKNPLLSTILIIFNNENADFYKNMKNLTTVDCSKIDSKFIFSYIINILAKNNIGASEEAINDLMLLCDNDMARITNELEKLVAYAMESKQITAETIKEFVNSSKEFQTYELAEFIAKGDSVNAIKLVDSFMIKSGTGFQILAPLYNNYRRALYVTLNKDKTTAELAKLLGVKEFAIRMLSQQIKVFNPKQLKLIVDMIALYDKKIKTGEMKEAIAIKMIVFNILSVRGKDGKF